MDREVWQFPWQSEVTFPGMEDEALAGQEGLSYSRQSGEVLFHQWEVGALGEGSQNKVLFYRLITSEQIIGFENTLNSPKATMVSLFHTPTFINPPKLDFGVSDGEVWARERGLCWGVGRGVDAICRAPSQPASAVDLVTGRYFPREFS